MPATSGCGPVVTTVSVPFELLLTVPTNPSVYQTSWPEIAIPNGAMTRLFRTFGECAGPSPAPWAEALDAVRALNAVAVVHATTAVMARIFLDMWLPLVVLESSRSASSRGVRRRRTFDGREALWRPSHFFRFPSAVREVCPKDRKDSRVLAGNRVREQHGSPSGRLLPAARPVLPRVASSWPGGVSPAPSIRSCDATPHSRGRRAGQNDRFHILWSTHLCPLTRTSPSSAFPATSSRSSTTSASPSRPRSRQRRCLTRSPAATCSAAVAPAPARRTRSCCRC